MEREEAEEEVEETVTSSSTRLALAGFQKIRRQLPLLDKSTEC